nr:S8 family serine peptidase [Kribbella sandramycini]
MNAPGAAAAPPPAAAKEPAAVQVTLLTGDRVTVQGGELVGVEPAKGRKRTGFRTFRDQDRLYVVPADAEGEIASGRLDRALFDVAGLIKSKYDDKSTTSIPVLVTYSGKAPEVQGAAVTRRLAKASALQVGKDDAAGFLGATLGARASGVQKIWLDGKRRLTLDRSVPQIGAPAAWQAGYTGKGVKVAVLDGGIDTSHPDLATQVAGARNFTVDPDGDRNGHGTHVASTIAGTAAASGGKYKGVAPEATLYDGKVCDDFGECQFSAIIAGMEWAATEVKAKVVNVSLGGLDTPGIDPIEETVNRLSAATDSLFVIAAGNEGPGAGTVGSPGSAEAALTVGAVDKQDKLAEFSSRGPRVGDEGIKPDVTAPGVGIVAAKAKDATIGTPVGDHYLELEGTSMATPHVAGAAALLAQQHPDWSPATLKGALMGSAKPAAEQTVFEQGAGRVDVAKGIKQLVVAEPSSLSFGIARFPHDDDVPIVKTLTYRNTGAQPVTLDLAATLTGPNGAAGPISLSTRTLTVPARGTADVAVTVVTKHDGPDGGYTGRVTATAGELSVTAAVAVTKEIESYDLTVKSTGPDGKPSGPQGAITNVDTGASYFLGNGEQEQVTYRLPKGLYNVEVARVDPEPSDPERYRFYTVVQPALQLTKDTVTDLDLRIAKPVKLTVPHRDAVQAFGLVGYQRTSASGGYVFGSAMAVWDNETAYAGQIGPALPPKQLSGQVATYWAKPSAPRPGFYNSPYLYATLDEQPGRYPTGFTRNVKTGDMARVDLQLNAVSADRQYWVFFKGAGRYTNSGLSAGIPFDQPGTTTAYVEAAPVSWSSQIVDSNRDGDHLGFIRRPLRTYEAAKCYQERSYAAVFAPSPTYAGRTGNELTVYLAGWTDADGNLGSMRPDSASTKLRRDGQVVAESPFFGTVEATNLPPGKAKYTVESSTTRDSSSFVSTRTDLRWTFESDTTPKEIRLPIVGLRYQPNVDLRNAVQRTPISVLPFTAVTQPGAPVPTLRTVTLEISGDDGRTWHQATVTPQGANKYQATFPTPENARSISLRSQVIDAQGNSTELTTLRAYTLK